MPRSKLVRYAKGVPSVKRRYMKGVPFSVANANRRVTKKGLEFEAELPRIKLC